MQMLVYTSDNKTVELRPDEVIKFRYLHKIAKEGIPIPISLEQLWELLEFIHHNTPELSKSGADAAHSLQLDFTSL